MPEYLAPGVYVEEVSAGPRPIEGVATSTAGFVGQTTRGPTAVRLVTSWSEFERWYGGHAGVKLSYLPYAVQGFFANGGQRAFVGRIVGPGAVAAQGLLETDNAAQSLALEAIGPGTWGNRIFAKVSDGTRSGFRLRIAYYSVAPPLPHVDFTDPANINDPNRREPDFLEDFDNLGFDPLGANYVKTTVNGASCFVIAEWSDTAQPGDRPNNTAGFVQLVTAAGTDGAAVTAPDYIGNSALPTNERTGLAALELIDEIALLCVPDEVHPTLLPADRAAVMGAVIDQCEKLKDRFAVIQLDENPGAAQGIMPPRDTKYAAVYHPWIRVYDSHIRDTVLIPPGGHVVGIYARTDIERGVHKAPANEDVRGIILRDLDANTGPLKYRLTKGDQDILNPRGVNVIRDFRSDRRGVRVWGARTLTSDPMWKYVNVRRLFIYIEESIDEGTQWVVFEPNDEPLWAAVKRTITNFLIRVWKSGALMGVTQDEAFFVKCDRTTMTQDDIDNGRLICLIGIAPVKPAEFVIFRISQKTLEIQA